MSACWRLKCAVEENGTAIVPPFKSSMESASFATSASVSPMTALTAMGATSSSRGSLSATAVGTEPSTPASTEPAAKAWIMSWPVGNWIHSTSALGRHASSSACSRA